jgi:hypothetical protein
MHLPHTNRVDWQKPNAMVAVNFHGESDDEADQGKRKSQQFRFGTLSPILYYLSNCN